MKLRDFYGTVLASFTMNIKPF